MSSSVIHSFPESIVGLKIRFFLIRSLVDLLEVCSAGGLTFPRPLLPSSALADALFASRAVRVSREMIF